MNDDPFKNPNWQAMARECKLTRQLLGSGVSALGKADYANGKGNYYVSFFGLSIGIERFAKLILTADHIVEYKGQLPAKNKIRKFGHDIDDLLKAVEGIQNSRSLKTDHKKPDHQIANNIIDCLDSFADAKRGRYSNFEELSNPNFDEESEPIKKWWELVSNPILKKHFEGTEKEKTAHKNSEMMSTLLGDKSFVLYTHESGELITDIGKASLRTGENKVIQTFGRFYVLEIIRWLAEVFNALTHTRGYEKDLSVLFCHYEHFSEFRDEDARLKSKKVWP